MHYKSSPRNRATRSVRVAEVHALVYAFGQGHCIRRILEELMGRRVENEVFVESRTLVNNNVKNSTTAERRLQIGVGALRKSDRKGELKNVGWIPGKQHAADVLTKEVLSQKTVIWKLLTTNAMYAESIGCYLREPALGHETYRKRSAC